MNILLDGKQKAKMGGIVVLMIIGALLEACSIGLVIPVITTLLDPAAVTGDGYLGDIYRFLGMESTGQFTIIMLLAIIAAFVLKNIFLYFQNVIQLRFVYTNQFATSRKMMINFMERPYEYYLNADTSVIQRSITSDVNNMYGLILSSLQLTSEIIMFVVLIVVLMTQDPVMILTIAALLVVVLLIIKGILKPIMIRAGEENQEYYSGLYKWIDQSVMGIKEIKIANKENYFINENTVCKPIQHGLGNQPLPAHGNTDFKFISIKEPGRFFILQSIGMGFEYRDSILFRQKTQSLVAGNLVSGKHIGMDGHHQIHRTYFFLDKGHDFRRGILYAEYYHFIFHLSVLTFPKQTGPDCLSRQPVAPAVFISDSLYTSQWQA